MALLDHEIARRDGSQTRLELRPAALRLTWTLRDLITADGHGLAARFAASVRALDEPAERQMLLEAFFTRPGLAAVTADDVVRHFAPALQSAAARIAGARPAGDWTGPSADSSAFLQALRDAAGAVAFSCGLELLAPFHLDLQSPTLQQQQRDAAQRQLAEQRAAGRIEHLQRAVSLLQQFQALRQAAPTLSPGRLLEQMAPTDRAGALHTLFQAAAEEAPRQSLYLVAGPSLLRVEADAPSPRRLALPSTLGPLRSIRPAKVESQPRLLIGARNGLLLADPNCPAEAVLYPHESLSSPLGFNGAAILGSTLYASHSEAGLVAWNLNDPAAPPRSIPLPSPGGAEPMPEGSNGATFTASASFTASVSRSSPASQGARNLTALDDGRLLLSVGASLYLLDRAGNLTPVPLATNHPILAIVPLHVAANLCREVGIVCGDGSVQILPVDTLIAQPPRYRAGRLSAVGAFPWLGATRLLLATEDGPILCVGPDDTLVTQYLGPHRGLRHLAASHRQIAALSPDRQRLIFWDPASPQAPREELSVAATAGHRVADFVFV